MNLNAGTRTVCAGGLGLITPKMTGAPGLAPETWDSIRPKNSIPLLKLRIQRVLEHRSIPPRESSSFGRKPFRRFARYKPSSATCLQRLADNYIPRPILKESASIV
jgi:hypothetical protein